MKKSIFIFLILMMVFVLAGCEQPSMSLDKNDVKLAETPDDYEFTKVVSYSTFSKYITYTLVEENMRQAKMSLTIIGSGSIQINTMALLGADPRTGERIGQSKTSISCYNPMFGVKGSQIAFIRGNKNYIDENIYYYSGSKKSTIADKYYMDIPESSDSIKAFLSSSEDDFVSVMTLVNELKEGGLIEDPDTVIKKATKKGITYYKIEFGRTNEYFAGVEKYLFIIAMNGKKLYGIRARVDMADNGSSVGATLYCDLRPVKKAKFEVPTEFDGYITYAEHQNNIQVAIRNL